MNNNIITPEQNSQTKQKSDFREWLNPLIVGIILGVVFTTIVFFINSNTRPTAPFLRGTTLHEVIVLELNEALRLITLDVELEQTTTLDEGRFWGRLHRDVTFHGSGSFTVDLADVEIDDIAIDDRREQIHIVLPRPRIEPISIDPYQTTFYDLERGGIRRFADITLTPEEHNMLQADIMDAMRLEMLSEHMTDAYVYSEMAVVNLLQLLRGQLGEVGNYDIYITWR